MMEQSVLIMAIFVGAGLLAYVVVPGLILVWDRVLDAVEKDDQEKRRCFLPPLWPGPASLQSFQ